MINFQVIRWKNLLSTGNVFTEIPLNKHKTTLIVGENGAGKSTLLDAISFALFGKAFRKINKPQLLNTITGKGLVVEVEFSIGPNNYKIIRGIKPTVFEVYQNGNLLNQSAETKDYQEILEKQILKVNHKSFCQVVILGTASFVPFMQLAAAQRREIIEDLLDLQIFTTMNSLLKDKIAETNSAYGQCENEIALCKDRIELLRDHMRNVQNDNEKMMQEKRDRIVTTEKEMVDTYELVKALDDEIEKLEGKTEDYDKLSKKLSQLSKLRNQIEVKLDILKGEVNFFNKNDQCPTCNQIIDADFKCTTVDTKEKEIDEIKEGLVKLGKQYDKIDNSIKEIMKIHKIISEKTRDNQRLRLKIESLIQYKESLEEEIKNRKSIQANGEEKKIRDNELRLEELAVQYKELTEQKNLYAVAATMLKDSGIKSRIVKQFVPIINKLINKYLSTMEFMCQFELNENFEETLKSRYRDTFSYGSFSEGEKFRINLAILFTWRAIAKMRNSINTNILIMDEVMDSSLDGNGTEEFLKLINNLTADTNTFIISHKKDIISDKFEHVIRFEKHKNFSRISS